MKYEDLENGVVITATFFEESRQYLTFSAKSSQLVVLSLILTKDEKGLLTENTQFFVFLGSYPRSNNHILNQIVLSIK